MAQGLREAVALDPGFLLAWDGLAQSLTTLARRAQPDEAAQLRGEAAAARARIEALAPDSWIARRERAYALFGEGRFAEAIAIAKAIMDDNPRSWEHTYPYTFLTFAVGRLEESFRIVAELQAAEPLAMFMSRDQQWVLMSLRRFADAEAEYARSMTLAGSRAEPQLLRFSRLLARADTDPAELRAQFRAMQDAYPMPLPAFVLAFEPLLGDRAAMLESLRQAAAARPTPSMVHFADALGDAELAASILRATWSMPRAHVYSRYELLWTAPHSALRSTAGFKAQLRESGLVDYWRQSGKWADACRPLGDDDFECR
jgi:tetratricopeptide (TPR) repeat protein